MEHILLYSIVIYINFNEPRIKSNIMSPNVLGWRRFCCPKKRNRRFCRAAKMWVEQNTAEGAARTVFCGTLEPPNGGGTLTVC